MALMRRARKPGVKELEPPPIPAHFRCPISLDLMRDPVTAPSGITYDRRSIEAWLDMGNTTCPVTKRDIGSEPELIPNHSLRRVIQDWCVANRSVYGIERIPTPKIPVTAAQVTEILSEIAAVSGGARDESRASELAAKVKGLVGESERNRRCFMRSGAGRALAEAFVLWSSARPGPLEGILSALISVSPLEEETLQVITIGSPSTLRSVVAILKSGSLAARLNAALLVNQLLVSSSHERAAEADGLVEAVFGLIKRPISAQATKAALVATFRLATYDKRTAARFAELGLVPLLLEALVDADRSFCEKALAVLDAVLSSPRAKAESRDHALTVPVLLKKMFRVSDMATELVVSVLYKLFKGSNGKVQEAVVVEGGEEEEEEEEKRRRECVIVEAQQMGAFQKLLLLLQVGCSGETKERATWLLKMLNGHSDSVGCVDSMDFRGIKRPTQSFNN